MRAKSRGLLLTVEKFCCLLPDSIIRPSSPNVVIRLVKSHQMSPNSATSQVMVEKFCCITPDSIIRPSSIKILYRTCQYQPNVPKLEWVPSKSYTAYLQITSLVYNKNQFRRPRLEEASPVWYATESRYFPRSRSMSLSLSHCTAPVCGVGARSWSLDELRTPCVAVLATQPLTVGFQRPFYCPT